MTLRYTRNSGAAFGVFGNGGVFLAILAATVVGALLLLAGRGAFASSWQQLAAGLIIGGASGNLVDRLRLGYVTDFIDVGRWPTFNVADTAITVGIALVVIHGLTTSEAPESAVDGSQ